jgi:lysophospholipase L1-like esterase
MAKLPLHVLVEKIQSGKISEKELARYFIVEPNPAQPFDFLAGINPNTVDVTNVERTALLADPLLDDATRILERSNLRRGGRAGFRYKRKFPIIAEGDSWFKLPSLHPLVPWTLIDILKQKYPIINLAHWGDTLADIILAGEFWPYLMSGQSDVFLFSAGGNDVLGGGKLHEFINQFDVNHSKPADAPYYVKTEFFDNLYVITRNYEELITQIGLRAPGVMMVGHGYDYVIPRDGGPWLGGPLNFRGLNMIDHPKLCQAIIDILIDAFNNRLKGLQIRYPKNFRYVDLRGTVKPGEWWDELHPKDAGAKKTAAKFAAVIEALPASGTLSPSLAAAHRLSRAA